MLGNDVIDLADPETVSRHPRFDARVFSRAERAVLAAAPDAHRMRQILWAAKESTYKAARRHAPETVFSPRRFAVELEGDGAARVRFPGGAARVRVERDGDCVHAVAILEGSDPRRLVWATGPLPTAAHPNAPSEASRALAVAALAPRLRADPARLCIGREGRLPCLEGCTALSLSHHGRFVAYAALLAPPTGAIH
jgi:phosphopantetheinyl transferase (holo-ACP synthase)